jgi:hypothetical protein
MFALPYLAAWMTSCTTHHSISINDKSEFPTFGSYSGRPVPRQRPSKAYVTSSEKQTRKRGLAGWNYSCSAFLLAIGLAITIAVAAIKKQSPMNASPILM